MPLGEEFVNHEIADPEELEQALRIQSITGGKIGEILLAMGSKRAIDYYKVLAAHYQIQFINLLEIKIDESLLKNKDKEKYFKQMSIPIAFENNYYTVATAIPDIITFQRIKNEYGENTNIVCTSKFDILWSLQKCFNTEYLDSSIHELSKKYARLSAKHKSPIWQKIIYTSPFFALGCLLLTNLKLALLIINCSILIASSVMIAFKLILSIIGLLAAQKQSSQSLRISEESLPIYSILVAIYQESEVTLTHLFHHLKKINYPRHKLDIKILLEEDDFATIAIIKKMRLPSYIEYIYVPASQPRTKAKACNYGFKFIRGSYLCLYDAEDQPEPDQLLRVVQLFEESKDEKIACVQCKLNFYNSNENWLTRMFTIEYTYWFDLLLPALSFVGIPIPLGGTSNHFRADILSKVVAWDPFNVTEDADLGLRLSRLGYKIKILDSTTYEEANCQLINWVKQRTRWVKGYMQTYVVHMRNPFELWRKIGTRGFLGFQLFIGGTILSNLANIPLWLVSILILVVGNFDTSYYFPGSIYTLAILNLYIGTGGIILLNVLGVIIRKRKELIFSALTSPIYWLLMSFASYRAIYQLILKPSHWEKTQHGISRWFGDDKPLEK